MIFLTLQVVQCRSTCTVHNTKCESSFFTNGMRVCVRTCECGCVRRVNVGGALNLILDYYEFFTFNAENHNNYAYHITKII